jgi:hypothetical protein
MLKKRICAVCKKIYTQMLYFHGLVCVLLGIVWYNNYS